MVWRTWRGVFGGCVAASLTVASATIALAQTLPFSMAPTAGLPPVTITLKPTEPATPAAPPAKAATAKTAAKAVAKKPDRTQPAKRIATTSSQAPVKNVAAAAAATTKAAPTKQIAVVADRPAEATKVAAVAPKPAPSPPAAATPRNGVTDTTTRNASPPVTATTTPVASLTPPTAPSAITKIAAVPVSLTQRTETAAPPSGQAPPPTKPAMAAPAPEKQATPPAAGAQPSTEGAVAFVSNFLNQAFHIAKSGSATSLQRRAQLADLFASKMDVKTIAGYTTADELTTMSPDIQQRFRTILVSYLVETYYPRLELASDPSVTVETTPAAPLADGSAVVWTTFTKTGWGSQSVKWRVAAEDGGFKIVDIFSAGASLVQMERDTFASVMRDGGVNELMAKLDARTKQLATAATE